MRSAEANRTTGETRIHLFLDLEGLGKSDIDTGVGFLDHMLVLLAKHSGFDLVVKCDGDTYVDDHHSVEDIGISLGQAFAEAIGDKRGIFRYADTTLAMDEALILTSVDISGRSYLAYNMDIPTETVGTFDTELVEEFLLGFVRHAGITLHVRQLAGKNSHHIIEGMFKSLAHTLRKAVAFDERFRDEIPSTKGILTENTFEEEFFLPDTRRTPASSAGSNGSTARAPSPVSQQSASALRTGVSMGMTSSPSGPKIDSPQPVVSRGLGDGSYAKGIAKGVTQALNREEYERFSLLDDSEADVNVATGAGTGAAGNVSGNVAGNAAGARNNAAARGLAGNAQSGAQNATGTANGASETNGVNAANAVQARGMNTSRNSGGSAAGIGGASAAPATHEKLSLKDRVLRRNAVDDVTMVQSSVLQRSQGQRSAGSKELDQTRTSISGSNSRESSRKLSSTEALEKELQEKGLL